MNVKLLLKSLLILSLFSSYLAANDEEEEFQTKCEKKYDRCIEKCDDKDADQSCYDKCDIKHEKCAEKYENE